MPSNRYDAVAVVLHWAIAAAVLANLACGWWMGGALEDPALKSRAIAAFQLHKSLGLTVLALTALRLLWRLAHRPPALPPTMRPWERFLAVATHWAFYALMVALPLTGWLNVSAQWADDKPLNVPTVWFGLFRVPHLFHAAALPADSRKVIADGSMETHETLAWIAVALLVLHVLAALKHHVVDRDAVLSRMVPGVRAKDGAPVEPAGPGRRAVLALGFAAIAAGLLALGLALWRAGGTAAGPAAEGTVASVTGSWQVDPAQSEIAFAGEQAGSAFRGRFTRWQADIRFDPAAPERSTITATVDTASATDGVPLHDQTLPQAEWFDVAKYPQATFRATRIAARAGGGYELEGTLTIKDRPLRVPPLSLAVRDGVLAIDGTFPVDRGEANLGQESDSAGEYVSRRIDVTVKVRATAPK